MATSFTARVVYLIAAPLLGLSLPVEVARAAEREAILQWRGHVAKVVIEIVRGDVKVVRKPRGDVELEAFSSGAPINLEVIRADGGWLLRDVYPDRPTWLIPRECLRPPGEHGDYYARAGRVEVTIRAPVTTIVEVRRLELPASGPG
jgi:hypothetical protein